MQFNTYAIAKTYSEEVASIDIARHKMSETESGSRCAMRFCLATRSKTDELSLILIIARAIVLLFQQ
jgi:hypothetical protein